ncbi:MAG: ABC transporter permease [Cellulomonadaceae bacterium]
MTATTQTQTTTPGARAGASGAGASLRRVAALGRTELTLLVRNRTALFNAIAIAPLMVLVLVGVIQDQLGDAGSGAVSGMILTALIGFGLMFIVYYNITATAVARREELTLKRLTTGEVTREQILVAMAVPAVTVVLAQLLAGYVVLAMAIGLPAMVNPVLVAAAVVLGVVVFVLLGYASSGVTRSVESAQITTIPVLGVAILFSGLTLPLSVLPDTLRTVAELTPLAPVVDLLRLGLTGLTAGNEAVTFASSFEHAAQPLVVLAAWVALGALATRRLMRWEPRR